MAKLTQVMVDKIFSFSELGQQEHETSAYITGILERARIRGRARLSRDADCLVRTVGFGITRDLHGQRHRWDPQGQPEAGRRLARAARPPVHPDTARATTRARR